ncbi:hypothetical protein Scep_005402 [Stephania cephalantha]|uniref:Uncharacterized protein n=1 Tax=Stephania cephalantha TaxID=152367 RepID=A0AAP0PWB7_9MAGN
MEAEPGRGGDGRGVSPAIESTGGWGGEQPQPQTPNHRLIEPVFTGSIRG